MTEKALRARRRNFAQARNQGEIKLWRGHDETWLIKLLIWQAFFDPEPRPSQRALARMLGVWPSYVCKVQKRAATNGMDALTREGRRITLHDLAEARRVTSRLKERAPDLFASVPQPRPSREQRVMTADESIAEQRREVNEWKRKNLPRYPTRRRNLVTWRW